MASQFLVCGGAPVQSGWVEVVAPPADLVANNTGARVGANRRRGGSTAVPRGTSFMGPRNAERRGECGYTVVAGGLDRSIP